MNDLTLFNKSGDDLGRAKSYMFDRHSGVDSGQKTQAVKSSEVRGMNVIQSPDGVNLQHVAVDVVSDGGVYGLKVVCSTGSAEQQFKFVKQLEQAGGGDENRKRVKVSKAGIDAQLYVSNLGAVAQVLADTCRFSKDSLTHENGQEGSNFKIPSFA